MVSLWSFAAGMLKQTVQPAAAPACLTRFWRDWECSLGNRLCFFSPPLTHFDCSVRLWTVLSSLHPSTVCVCVCVCGGWVLTGIFLHLLILSPHSLSEHRTRRTHTSTRQCIHSLSAPILPFFSFLSPFIYFCTFCGFFLPPPIFVHFDPPPPPIALFPGLWCWSDVVSVLGYIYSIYVYIYIYICIYIYLPTYIYIFLLAKQEVELYRYGMCQQSLLLSFSRLLIELEKLSVLYHLKSSCLFN